MSYQIYAKPTKVSEDQKFWSFFFLLFGLGAIICWWMDRQFYSGHEVTLFLWAAFFQIMLIVGFTLYAIVKFLTGEFPYMDEIQLYLNRFFPPLILGIIATGLVNLTDPLGYLKYSRYLPFIWISTYGMALFSAHPYVGTTVNWVGRFFFSVGVMYAVAGLLIDRIVFEWASFFLVGTLGFGHLFWALVLFSQSMRDSKLS